MLFRWHRARASDAVLTAAALHERLVTGEDRRKVLKLRLPDDRGWTGGERELVRRVLADAALEAGRPVRLSASGIRRRLSLLAASERHDAACVARCFGFSHEHQPEWRESAASRRSAWPAPVPQE